MSEQINAVATRLPEFSHNESLTWFLRAETRFGLRGITQPTTKADYVLEVLPETIFWHIAYDPPVHSRYRRLRPELHQIDKETFTEMEKMGVCSKAATPWASPLHMTPRRTAPGGPAETTDVSISLQSQITMRCQTSLI